MQRLYNYGFQYMTFNDIQDLNRTINIILTFLSMNCIRMPVDLKVIIKDIEIILMNIHHFHGRNRLISQFTNESHRKPDLSTPLHLNFKTFSSDELQVDVKELIIEEHYTSLYILTPFSSITNERIKTDTSSASLSRLIEKLSTSEGMDILRKLLSCERTFESPSFATWPTFEIEKNLDMRVLLRELGVGQLLTTNGMLLDRTFAEGNQFVHFGNAVHRARVKVTKENVRAAAVTLISGQEPCSDDIIRNVDTNYPFVWLIYDKMNADILYIGVFNAVDKTIPQIRLTEIDMTYKSSRRSSWSSGSSSEWFSESLHDNPYTK
ncbi:serine protease inhibitor 88Ea-like [Nylanderia fulva]|uniref:serine protease inhibitor 88Ea-like n=1 Tax=Nylanderia fulva TaxID=613905 RepID=UPI0010FAD1AB|nr:serine protease inhibitor 88Ea-like [Nylanderia fulva]